MFNQEVKGNLAKLLATENLTVEHKNVSTASFDVLNRVLTLPIWKQASSIVYDLLVGHEVGHALYTPTEDWTAVADVPKDYVNVVEDARVEKLMKRKFPGLAKSFYKGYQELNNDDFFCINDEKLDRFSLIDRINLYFKIGAYAQIPFDSKELFLVDLVEQAETFDDVLDACRKIQEYVKENMQDTAPASVPANMENSEQSNGGSSSSSVEGESVQSSEQQGGNSSENSETESEAGQEKETAQDSSSFGGGFSGADQTESKTQQSFEQKVESLAGRNSFEQDFRYVEVPEVLIDNVIIDVHTLNEYISNHFSAQPSEYFQYPDAEYVQYRKEMQKEVNYLVKEFECKKSADAYARTSTSRTGVLDTKKLHTYKYNEDLFRKVSVIPDGKNHGLIFVLDWSGSMCDYLMDTIKQLISLTQFCRKCQIPFEVYAFTYEWNERLVDPECQETSPKYVRKDGALCVHKHFHLLNFLSSRSNTKEYEESCRNLWRLAYPVKHYATYRIPLGLDLSGTPLNESIICLHKIIPNFKNQNKLQKVNVVILTDGEANQINFDVTVGDHFGHNRVGYNTVLRDRKTGNVYRPVTNTTYNDSMTSILLENLGDNFPEVNIIGFRVISTYEFNRLYRSFYNISYMDDRMMSNASKIWKKEKSLELNGCGYAALYAISSTGLSVSSEFSVKDDANKTEIGKAFRQMLKNKANNKKILSSFAALVS